MERAAVWNARPIFITSTFQDMQAERSYLRNVVLPALEEWLRGKRRHIEWIDLRVGVPNAEIANEAERETLVLKVCLEGVKRSRPFLIALIGDRYGWIPPQERAERAVQEIPEASFSTAVANRSVTDLEIDFGAFHQANQAKRCLFFFRKPLPYEKMGETAGKYSEDYSSEADAADKKLKLLALKARIQGAFRPQCFDYEAAWDGKAVSGLEAFGKQVEGEIKRVLEAELAAAPELVDLTVEDLDRLELADFAEDRAHEFVGRDGLLADMERHITSAAKEGEPWGLCITGESGSGKSALFGALVQGLTHIKDAPLTERFQTTDVLVLAHAAGASPRAASVDVMLRRWIGELAAFLGVAPNLPENPKPDDVDAAFASLLGRAALKKRVVVLLDALDQFEPTPRGRFVTWLPKLWHENARLIATAIPGDASEALAKRPAINLKPIPPLDKKDGEKIAANISKHYGRTLETKVVEALLGGERWRNPLWLTLATEEVNLVDADDFARAKSYQGSESEKLRNMMADRARDLPPDVPGLYRNTFTYAAELFGAKTVEAFLGLIAVGRVGWRESDFRVLLPKLTDKAWDELRFAQLRRSFRGQLRQRGQGQWDFTHVQMRPAVRAWIKDVGGLSETALHTALGDHLLTLPTDDPLHISETMLHLMEGEDWEVRAANYYGGSHLTTYSDDVRLTTEESTLATKILAGIVLARDAADQSVGFRRLERLLCAYGADDAALSNVADRYTFDLFEEFQLRAERQSVRCICEVTRRALQDQVARHPSNTNLQRNLAVTWINIGRIFVDEGDLESAIAAFREGQTIFEMLEQSDQENVIWIRDLALTFDLIGDVLQSQGMFVEAENAYGDSLDARDRLLQRDSTYVWWQRDMSVSLMKIGSVAQSRGNLSDAEKCFRDSLTIAVAILEANSDESVFQRDLSNVYDRLGINLGLQGKFDDALKCLGESRDICERLVLTDASNAVWQSDLAYSWQMIGEVLADRRDPAAALQAFEEARVIRERLANADLSNAEWQTNLCTTTEAIGRVHFSQQRLSLALQVFYDSLDIRQRLAEQNRCNCKWQSNRLGTMVEIGQVLNALGRPEAALKSLGESLEIERELETEGANSPFLQEQLVRIYGAMADALLDMERREEAHHAAKKARAIAESLADEFAELTATEPYLRYTSHILQQCTFSNEPEAPLTAHSDPVANAQMVAIDTIAHARAVLENGDVFGALDLVSTNGENVICRELTGVCQMRLGKLREALVTLRGVILPMGMTAMPDSTSPRLIANYATAQLLTGDIRGAKSTLDQVWDRDNPAISRLLDAIDRWEQSLSFMERTRWRFGSAPPKPFHLDPPYGEI